MLSREIDQLQRIVDTLRTNPTDRRIMLNAWNVGELEDMKLPPCHFAFSLWSRELDFETRLTMATDIGLQHSRLGYESIYTKMLYDLEMDGSVTETELDELGIPKRILNSCLVQRSVDTLLVCHSILLAMAFSLIFSRRLRVTWPVHLCILALTCIYTITTWKVCVS